MTPAEQRMWDLAYDTRRALERFEDNADLLNEILGFSDINEYFLNLEDDDEC